jgi:hypothetical protein
MLFSTKQMEAEFHFVRHEISNILHGVMVGGTLIPSFLSEYFYSIKHCKN